MAGATERREELKDVYREAVGCTRCALAQTRRSVVFGAGNADAGLMLVGEAPGQDEDASGLPFVGRAGKLLDGLLAEAGIERSDVFIANVLKCRPPGNRDPAPGEIESCRPWLEEQIRLIEPRVIATLGNFSTKLLRSDPTGITRVHGRAEVRRIGPRTVRLYPLYHPAAALRSTGTLEELRADVARLPELLALPPAGEDEDPGEVPEPVALETADSGPEMARPDPAREQLGLFDEG